MSQGTSQKKSLEERMADRYAAVDLHLSEKEQHLLTYVFSEVPKPYYLRWKQEANAIFTMVVSLKKRREAQRGRT